MSYTITRTNGAQVAVVADGTIDATLDLKLIGKNHYRFLFYKYLKINEYYDKF